MNIPTAQFGYLDTVPEVQTFTVNCDTAVGLSDDRFDRLEIVDWVETNLPKMTTIYPYQRAMLEVLEGGQVVGVVLNGRPQVATRTRPAPGVIYHLPEGFKFPWGEPR